MFSIPIILDLQIILNAFVLNQVFDQNDWYSFDYIIETITVDAKNLVVVVDMSSSLTQI